VEIKIRHSAPGKAEFEVTDTGVGISPEAMEGLFKRFRRFGSGGVENSEGTGLGLTICKELIENSLNGSISKVDSVLNSGTTFKFQIVSDGPNSPKSDLLLSTNFIQGSGIDQNDSEIESPEDRRKRTLEYFPRLTSPKFANANSIANKYKLTANDLAKVSVAIIDDDLFVIRHLKAMLQTLQVNTPYVYLDGLAAVDQLTKVKFDKFPTLVITDMYLPSMNGLQVAKKLRQRAGGKPYIVLNSAETEMVEKTQDIDEIIKKPTRIEQLLDVVFLAALRIRSL
jgi:CheY-like chemotaxis protein